MIPMRRMLPIIALLAAALPTAAEAFQSHIQFCNRTAQAVTVAIAYDAAGTTKITSRGWFNTAPCACRDLINEETRATEFFLWVAKQGAIKTGLLAGKAPLCLNPTKRFRFVAENDNQSACTRAGGHWDKFAFHDTKGERFFKVEFRRQGVGQCNL